MAEQVKSNKKIILNDDEFFALYAKALNHIDQLGQQALLIIKHQKQKQQHHFLSHSGTQHYINQQNNIEKIKVELTEVKAVLNEGIDYIQSQHRQPEVLQQ